jgi:hypothetical protein
VLRVGCAFHLEVAPGVSARADDLVARFVWPAAWQVCSVAGSKGQRRYGWAWMATTSPRHFLLIRRHLATGEPAFHYCHVPVGRPVTLMTLVRVACLRWPVEEDFEFGKDHFGLDHSQVRLYTALVRHIVLVMAALAVCVVTAAQAKTRAPAPILPTTLDEQLPPDPWPRSNGCSRWSPAGSSRRPITWAGSGGDGATRPEHAGFTIAPDSADKQQPHDMIKVRLP